MSEQGELELRFTLTRDEFVGCYRRVLLRRPVTLTIIVVAVAFAVWSVVSASLLLALVVLLWAGWLFLCLVVRPGRLWSTFPPYRGEQVFRLSPSGVTWTGDGAESRVGWWYWKAVSRAGAMYAIWGGTSFVMVPARAVADADQPLFDELLTLAGTSVPVGR